MHAGRDIAPPVAKEQGKVLESTAVIVVPGWGFGDTLKYAVRLSYGPLVHHLDKIDEAMKRVGKFLATEERD